MVRISREEIEHLFVVLVTIGFTTTMAAMGIVEELL
jgi:hypothetical protein